MLLVVVL